jgi:hypothetical protein
MVSVSFDVNGTPSVGPPRAAARTRAPVGTRGGFAAAVRYSSATSSSAVDDAGSSLSLAAGSTIV